jgi:nucleolysin TIA-1/TIAR
VGNLDPSVSEEFITTLFGQIGLVTKTKVIFDANSDPYAFVEFVDHYTATQALTAMNRRLLLDKEMKVNWATQPGTQQKIDTSKHFHVFVGDLSPEVDNKALKDAFSPFGEVSDAKVIKDPQTQKSKGYGFVSYPKREEAERAIEQMNGQWLGRRTIRTNWATRKPTEGGGGGGRGGAGGDYYHSSGGKNSYEDVYNQTGPENCSVYVGNLSQNCTDEDVRQAFRKFGNIVDIRHFKPQGFSFVRFDKKESAARAICDMNGSELMGQNLRCSWGKSESARAAAGDFGGLAGYGAAGAAGGYGGAATAAASAYGGNPAAAAQYWNYMQYYNNPQVQQQQQGAWQNYYQQQQPPQ